MNQNDIDNRALALLKAADSLAALLPQQYMEFVRALGSYAEVANMRMLHANASNVLNAQGQAQMAIELTELLANSKQNLETLVAKRAAQRRAQQPTKRSP